MGAMAVMPRDGWTVDDLAELPDDGNRYEVLDGRLLVTPAPRPIHQRVSLRLAVVLDAARPAGAEVFCAPVDYRPTGTRSVQPDLLVVRCDDVGERFVEEPPLLVVEILSPGTHRVDLTLKRRVYAEAGVPAYWVVDPDPVKPAITVLGPGEVGSYREVAYALADQPLTVEVPFPVTVVPAALVGAAS